LLTDDGVDSVLVVCAPAPRQSTAELVAAVASARATASDKTLVACVFGPHPTTITPAPDVADVPVFDFPDAAAYALGRVTQYARWRAEPEGQLVVPDGADPAAGRAVVVETLANHVAAGVPADSDRWLPADVAIDALVAAGLPMVPSRVVHDEAGAVAAAGELGYPVAVKAITRARQAKTEAGGMALDVHGEGELRATLCRMHGALGERLWPAVVQPMVDPGLDMAITVTLSPVVGPVVSLGAGGVATDVAPAQLHVLPLTDHDARRFVGGSSLAPFLGDRSRDVLEDLLLRVGALVEGIPEVVGLELNPVIVSPAGASIVDARLRAATVERDPVPPVRRI